MGQLLVNEYMTLDGVIQAPGGPDEDRSGGFPYGGWQAPLLDQESMEAVVQNIEGSDALLLGRRTYEIFAGYWPKAEGPIARKFNAMPKYVASRTLRRVAWANSTLVGPDLNQEVARVKSRHQETHVFGSGDLVQSLLRERLVDRFNLWVCPLTLGSGKRLFEKGMVPTALKLVRSRAFPKGSVLLTYETRGEPTYGTVGEEGA